MADQTSSSIVVDADVPAVMAVIADFGAYPSWAKGVKRADVLAADSAGRARQVRFELDASPIRDTCTLAYRWQGDRAVSWTLVEAGLLKVMTGRYSLAATGSGTDVRYELTVDLNIPMIGLLKRKAERVVIDAALKGLKTRVESLG